MKFPVSPPALLVSSVLASCQVGAQLVGPASVNINRRSFEPATNYSSSCSAAHISIPPITGLEVVSVEASVVLNASVNIDWDVINNVFPVGKVTGLNYCNVTVTSIHPGYREKGIKTGVYLPLSGWNERMMGVGGSGFISGNIPGRVEAPVYLGFATVSTSAGVSKYTMSDYATENFNSDLWALRSTGNVDLEVLSDFSYRALGDAAAIGKAVIESFYKITPKFRYFNGCSAGGRQAHMLAQRYPDAYHGLLGGSPAINWARMVPAELAPQVVLKEVSGGVVPPPVRIQCYHGGRTRSLRRH